MLPVKWNPFNDILDIFGAFDRPQPFLPVDITSDDKATRLSADMPGMEVDVSIDGDILRIVGERKTGEGSRRERFYGKVTRAFTLPDHVDRDGISGVYEHGVLALTLPHKEKAVSGPQQVKVEIKT